MSEEIVAAVKKTVDAELKTFRENYEGEMKNRLKAIEDEFTKTYRTRLLLVVGGVTALLLGLVLSTTSQATKSANEAVIMFQNGIIERQKAVIQTEEAATRLIGRVTDAQNKVNKAEADLQIASEKLKAMEDRLKATNDGLVAATDKYDEMLRRLQSAK